MRGRYTDGLMTANDTDGAAGTAARRRWKAVLLTAEQLDELSARDPLGNFQQGSRMAALAARHGSVCSNVGLTDADGHVVAGAMIAYTPSRFGMSGSIWLGPICDPDDTPMLSALSDAIRADAKRHHAIEVAAWPNLVYRLHASDGTPTEEPHDGYLRAFEGLGWSHQPLTCGYDSVINRWVYVKDLTAYGTADALLKSYAKRTQWSIERARSMGVVVREVGVGELRVFADIERQTAQRRHFAYRGEQYFRDFAAAFGDRAHFLIAYIDTAAYEASMRRKAQRLEELVAGLEAKLAQRETTKLRRRHNEESSNLKAARKRLDAARGLTARGAMLPAACSLFVTHPNETVYLYSGSVEEYKPFYASALIQHEAMVTLCLDKGITRYNFYGIDGVFDDPDSEGHGVLEFKQGFNGHVEELVGEFTLPVGRARLALRNTLKRVLG
ncbi:peptidoglycan bridge formation protein FemAB [Bifidobacterium castoris]|uniref:Peptidoglycan bridge formation protein FemAB n=2 Tax=Bifidobacterium castoris TaxID=2306972 RepID=A0A430F975_9BIFI|nr:peptidoglycan bridge formation protein FemAB [Bifidobacterium castoris]